MRLVNMGSLTCAHIWMHAAHTEGDQAQTSLHKSGLGGTETLSLTLHHQGIEPWVFGNEFRRSNHVTRVVIVVAVRIVFFRW